MKNEYKYCRICFKKRLIKEFSEYKILDKTYYACYECLPPDEEPDDIPVEERMEIVEPHDSKPPEVTAWPTAKDIEECCGVWVDTEADGMPDGNPIKITHRAEFDRNVTDNGFFRLDPIPPQCVPGYEKPKRETPEWMRAAVERYPSEGDW